MCNQAFAKRVVSDVALEGIRVTSGYRAYEQGFLDAMLEIEDRLGKKWMKNFINSCG